MASVQKASSGGSIYLKVLIALLILVLGYAIYSPRKQWEQQARDLLLARQRMENLYNAGNLFFFFNKRFPTTIEEIVFALDTTFVDAEAVKFLVEAKQNMDLLAERDDLTRVEFRTPEEEKRLAALQTLIRDSLLITTEDTMRISDFIVNDLGKRAVAMPDGSSRELFQVRVVAGMKPLYAGVGSDTLCLDSTAPITIVERKAGDLSRDLWASTQGHFLLRRDSSYFAKGPTVRQPVKFYSLNLPLEEIGTCPATGKPFQLKLVGKFTYKGNYRFTIDGKTGEPLNTMAQKQAFLNELKNQATPGIGAAFSAMADSATKAGNPQYTIPEDVKVSVTVRETLAILPTIKTGQELLAQAEQFTIAGLDSSEYHSAEAQRIALLFPEFKGPAAKVYDDLLANPGVQALVNRVKVQSVIDAPKVDAVGLAVSSPITGDETYLTGWKRLFEVGAPENHGQIYNGTKSWE